MIAVHVSHVIGVGVVSGSTLLWRTLLRKYIVEQDKLKVTSHVKLDLIRS